MGKTKGPRLSTDEHKYNNVRGKRFLARARRERGADPHGSVTNEQRLQPAKEPVSLLPVSFRGQSARTTKCGAFSGGKAEMLTR
jgi:hypothetical protein